MPIRQLPSGNYRAEVYFKGARKSASASTEKEARLVEARLLLELSGSANPNSTAMTFARLLASHIETNREGWSAQYTKDCTRVAELIEPLAGHDICTIIPGDISALYRKLEDDGVSLHRLQRLDGLITGAFKTAIHKSWTMTNPAQGITPTAPKKPELNVPTGEQVAAIAAKGATEQGRLFLRLAAVLGIRRGELCGLKWGDLDERAGDISIRRARSVDENGRAIHSDGKTGPKGHRRLALDEVTVARLVAHREDQREDSRAEALPDPEWIFSYDAGATPWHPEQASDVYNAAREAAELEGVRLHDFRHYVATSMLQDGWPPIDVAQQLGDNVNTVLRTYAHWMPGRGRDAANARAALLG